MSFIPSFAFYYDLIMFKVIPYFLTPILILLTRTPTPSSSSYANNLLPYIGRFLPLSALLNGN